MEKEMIPRSLQDRYSVAIIEELKRLNNNIEKLIPKEIEKPKRAKRGEVNV